jgi:DNA-binding beta-propeller fold protein YncE
MSQTLPRCLAALVWALAATTVAAQPNPVKPPLFNLAGHTQMVHAVAVSADGKRIASASNVEVKVWDAVSGKEVFSQLTRSTNVYGVAFSPDGKLLAVGVSKTVRLLDAATGEQKQVITCGPHFLFRLAFSPDGKRLAAAGGNNGVQPGDVHVWEVPDAKEAVAAREVLTLVGHTEPPLNVNYSADGKYLVSCSGATSGTKAGEVRVWEADGGRLVHVLRGHLNNVYGVAISPDGRRVASGSGMHNGAGKAELKLWETVSGREAFAPLGLTGTVYTVAFSPDGRRVATGGSDGTMRLWDVLTGKEVLNVPAHTGPVFNLAFAPDGRRVITGGNDKTVKVWEIAAEVAMKPEGEVTAERAEALWQELGATEVGRAWQAVRGLADAPGRALPLLRERLRVVPGLNAEQKEQAERWVKELDHRRFTVRDQAYRELAKLGQAAGPVLREALERDPPLEVRRRIGELIERIVQPALDPEQVRELRAIEVLEVAGTAEARQLLEKLAGGLPDAPLTGEARAALARMTVRRP